LPLRTEKELREQPCGLAVTRPGDDSQPLKHRLIECSVDLGRPHLGDTGHRMSHEADSVLDGLDMPAGHE
jgi:hypothetical protein